MPLATSCSCILYSCLPASIPPKSQSFQVVPPGRCFDLRVTEYRLQCAGQSGYCGDEDQRPIVAEPSTELIPSAESGFPDEGRSVQILWLAPCMIKPESFVRKGCRRQSGLHESECK